MAVIGVSLANELQSGLEISLRLRRKPDLHRFRVLRTCSRTIIAPLASSQGGQPFRIDAVSYWRTFFTRSTVASPAGPAFGCFTSTASTFRPSGVSSALRMNSMR